MSPLVSTFAGAALRPYGFTLGGAAPAAFELISTQLITSSTSSVTFSSIASTWKHLQLRSTILTTGNSYNLFLRFNGVTGSSYRAHALQGISSGVYSTTTSATYIDLAGPYVYTSNTLPMATITDILDYGDTNKNKTVRSLNGQNAGVSLTSGLFISTSAISSLTIYPDTTTFASGTRFSLYGVKGS